MNWQVVKYPPIEEAGATWTTLDDHPADGARAYEDLSITSKALNFDITTDDPILLEITNRHFLGALFDVTTARNMMEWISGGSIGSRESIHALKGLIPLLYGCLITTTLSTICYCARGENVN
jgi:hypothetical protein